MKTPISFDRVVELVSEFYHVSITQMKSRKKTASITLPRHVSMYLAKKYTRHSYTEMGDFFGHRDHTSALHGTRRIEGQLSCDAGLAEQVAYLGRAVERMQSDETAAAAAKGSPCSA